MSLEALWTIEFQTADGWQNGGVVVLETGRVFGGDSQYYYLGKYELSGDEVEATIRAVHYHGAPTTAFGDQATDYTVEFEGKWLGNNAHGVIYRPENPQLKLSARLKRRSDLP